VGRSHEREGVIGIVEKHGDHVIGRSSHEHAYVRVHPDESLMKIDRALDAKVVIGNPASARSQSLLEMLGLGEEKKPQ
jgi:hypothetical protein